MHHEATERVAAWLGLSLDPVQWDLLHTFAAWLREEAIPAGSLGPWEAPRVWDRHIADSLVFAGGWVGRQRPESLLDLGSGAGLPGIPLAVAWPDVRVTLLDRSGRRSDLARRAVRLLGLSAVEVREEDHRRVDDCWDGVVTRATFPPDKAASAARRLLAPGGTAVVGLRGNPPHSGSEPFASLGRIVEVPTEILDGAVRLLIMSTGAI